MNLRAASDDRSVPPYSLVLRGLGPAGKEREAMKLQRREKILAGLALGLVGLAGLWFLFFAGDSRSDDQLISRSDQVDQRNREQAEAASGSRPRRQTPCRVAAACPASRPGAGPFAVSELAPQPGHAASTFSGTTLVANDAGARRDQFTRISFTLHAQAKLGDLVAVHVRILFGRLPPPDPQDGRQTDPEFPRVGRESHDRGPLAPHGRVQGRASRRKRGTCCSLQNCRTIVIRS